MKITKNYLTKNQCYIIGEKHTPKGVMVHSTATPGVMAAQYVKTWNQFQPNGRQVCVHAFIDDTGVYQTLPFDMVGWHSGTGNKGVKGNANNSGYIGFEICEPKDLKDKQYFEKVKSISVNFAVYLCKTYNLSVEEILTHTEGNKLGIASNHADIDHWWKQHHNYTMDMFRAEVKAVLYKENQEVELTVEEAQKIVQAKTGFDTNTMAYLSYYKFSDSLLLKLAKAMQ